MSRQVAVVADGKGLVKSGVVAESGGSKGRQELLRDDEGSPLAGVSMVRNFECTARQMCSHRKTTMNDQQS